MMAGKADEVTLESDRFDAAAEHYLAGRLAYSPALIDFVVRDLALGPSDRVLDLGCGPGQLALMFAPFVAEVVAIDPSPAMLAVGRRSASRLDNVRFLQGSSFDLAPDLGPFKFVAIGRAFHWMDRAQTLRVLDRMVPAEGAVGLFADGHRPHSGNHWIAAFQSLIQSFAAEDSERTRRLSAEWISDEEELLASPFNQVTRFCVTQTALRSLTDLQMRALSVSSLSPERLGPRKADLMSAIADLVAQFGHDGSVSETFETSVMLGRRSIS